MTDHALIQQFLDLMKQANAGDEALREKYGIAKKFKFIQEQLNTCVQKLETDLAAWEQAQAPTAKKEMSENQTMVYVHMFNAQGMALPTWLPMLSAGVLYEHSINRPIYSEEEYIKESIRLKPNPVQHAYFSVIIDKNTIKPKLDTHRDSAGQPLIKIKEGSLIRENIQRFFHNGVQYEILINEFKKVKN